MQGNKEDISTFMTGGRRFIIPCYQRPYSWTEAQCRTLWNDMLHVYEQHKHVSGATHFIGSIVSQKIQDVQSGYVIIDGQQRLTTIFLFYVALYRVSLKRELANNGEGIATSLKYMVLSIIATIGFGSALGRPRMEMTEHDQKALDKLFGDDENEFIEDSLLTKNYRLFYQWIEESNLSLSELRDIPTRLVFINISLEPGDDAQLIFESLNSKGLELSEGDKVRNFLLMGFTQDTLKNHYNAKWLPIEQNCGERLSEFILYFLAIKNGRAPSMPSLYLDFKDYVQELQKQCISLSDTKVQVMDELLSYSKLFARIRSCSYEMYAQLDTELSLSERIKLQTEIEQSLRRLEKLKYTVRTPVVLQLMTLHSKNQISGRELLSALKLLETFLFRRWVCGIPSHGLNRMFQALSSSFAIKPRSGDKLDIVGKLVAIMCSDNKDKGVSTLPSDEAFIKALHEHDMYANSRNREAIFYMFERLENAGSLEQVKIDDSFSIEHIMPQKLTDEWRAELGLKAAEIHRVWLHRLANLTLTAYNSKYSNSSFSDKCSMAHGFASSPLRLNRDIACSQHWGPEEMEQRAQVLIAKALEIWPYPGKTKSKAEAKPRVVTKFKDRASFAYCLADGMSALSGTKPCCFDFMGKHYEVNSWAKMQRIVVVQAYQSAPERLRSWLNVKWGKFNILEQFIKSNSNFTVAKSSPNVVLKIDEGVYFNTNQDTITKIKLFHQLFELMELDPHDLSMQLVYVR